jgi:hypothetical protein
MTTLATGRYELVGHVGVDSGTVVIIDPCYADRIDLERDVQDSLNGELKDAFGIIHATAMGDGIFPVFAEYVDDQLQSLTIRFWKSPEEAKSYRELAKQHS